MAKFAGVILLVFLCSLMGCESRCPTPTLPANGNDKYFQKFQKIPPPKETAEKLKKNFLGARKGYRGHGKKEDTVIVMDGSGSVGHCEFNKGKEALANLMKIGNDGGYDTRFACITFASSASINFNFLSPAAAAARMSRISYPAGWTNTQLGLSQAKSLLDKGSRKFSRRIVFLVTDGQSNIQRQLTVPNAKALKKDGVQIFVVAVGNYISGIDEMVRVASYPPHKFLFRVRKLQNFLTIVKLVIKEVSPGKYKLIKGQTNNSC